MLDWAGCTATQRLTCGGCVAAGVVNAMAVMDVVGLPDGLGAVVADWVADGEPLDVVGLPGLALGETLPDADADADAEGVGEGGESAVGLGDAEPLGVGVPAGGLVDGPAPGEVVPVLGVAVGLVCVGVGVGVGVGVRVGVGVGLGDGAGSCSGSHCCPVPPAVAVVTANSAVAAPGRLA